MIAQPKPTNQMVAKDRREIISDAYLRFALRLVQQQRTIEELKLRCGVE